MHGILASSAVSPNVTSRYSREVLDAPHTRDV